MRPFVSIVMPVYNAEKYLERAVESVIAQGERDWELVLVDDGSQDASPALCDYFSDGDERIRAVHLIRNGGLSDARNRGMEAAQGRYIMFMDSDDWIEENLLERLRSAAEQNHPDLIVWSVTEEYYGENEELKEQRPVCCENALYTDVRLLRLAGLDLERRSLLGYAWNKLYDRRLLEESGARFETVALIEDILFNLHVLEGVHTMQTMDCASYHYARRPSGSLTHRFIPDYYELSMRRIASLLTLYEGWGMKAEAVKALADIYARYVLSALQRNCDPRSGMNYRMRREFAKTMLASALYQEMRGALFSGSGMAALPGRVLALHHAGACLLAGRAVYFAGARMKGLFHKLSMRRQEAKS